MIKKILHKFKKQRDLTVGSISKNLWILAIPMLVSNVLQATFNLIDMFFVGKLGPAALAAVALSGSILMVVMFLMMGIAMGTMALVSRSIGAKNQAQANNAVMQSLIMVFWGSIIFGIIGYLLSPWVLGFLGANAEVAALGTGYLQITFLGVIAMFAMFLISGILQGAGDALTPMLILGSATILNIILDPLLIFTAGLGVNGAAWATVLSRGIGSLWALEVLLKGRSRIHVPLKHFKIDWTIIWRILKIGIPGSAQMSMRGLIGIVLFAIVAKFGTFAIASYGVCVRLQLLALVPGFALGMAAGTLVGQNLGAKQSKRAAYSAWMAVLYYGIFMIALAALYYIFAPYFLYVFNGNPEVVKIGTNYLRITVLGYVFVALGVVLNRSLSGAGDTIAPMIITFIALWLIQVPLAIYMSRFGLNGVWYAVLIAFFVQGTLATGWFLLGKWKHKIV